MGIAHMKYLKFFVFLCFLTFTVSCGQQKRYIQYKVQEGDTFEVIAKKLKMQTKKLKRLNPELSADPKANTFIVVPYKNLENYQNNTTTVVSPIVVNDSIAALEEAKEEKERLVAALEERYIIYEVKKGDTFYSLNKRLGVSREALLGLNPELYEGLKEGMIIKIRENPNGTFFNEVLYEDEVQRNTSLKAALLLPFRAARYQADTLTAGAIFGNSRLLNITTDFYLGAELAIDSLRKQGIAVSFNVYDTGERNSSALRTLLSTPTLRQQDVIIGPLYSDEVEVVANQVNVPVVFPVYSKNQNEFTSSNVVKTATEKEVFRQELQRFIANNFDEGNIIIVGDNSFASVQASMELKTSLEYRSKQFINILTPVNGYIEKDRFLRILQPNTNNWVIMTTENSVIVSDAINSLISLPEKTSARLFTYDKGSVYDRIDNRKLAKLGFTYVSETFPNATSRAAQIFTKKYFARNNALPSYYATKGFDITYDILMRLASGNSLTSTFRKGISSRVETRFNYSNTARSSENRGLFIIKYKSDLSLQRLQ